MTKPLDELELLFKALADGTRLRILGLLLTGEVCVCHMHESLKVPQPKASRHLAYLRRSGLVETRREGLWVYYRLASQPSPIVAAITEAVRHALTHVDTVHGDLARLQRKTGCCVPVRPESAGVECCMPETRPIQLTRPSERGSDQSAASTATVASTVPGRSTKRKAAS
jgi:ArsR family transcriptional regulator, arsenate/arsenite/antimonite-responsive transcriptional repressor